MFLYLIVHVEMTKSIKFAFLPKSQADAVSYLEKVSKAKRESTLQEARNPIGLRED